MLTSSITDSIAIGFSEDYKKLEKKEVKVEEFQNSEIAKQILIQAIVDYYKEYLKFMTAIMTGISNFRYFVTL